MVPEARPMSKVNFDSVRKRTKNEHVYARKSVDESRIPNKDGDESRSPMKIFFILAMSIQTLSALNILRFWDSDEAMSGFEGLSMMVWAITNLPGIIILIPLYVLGLGGIMHADALDGLGGYVMCIWPPTIVSLSISLICLVRIEIRKNTGCERAGTG